MSERPYLKLFVSDYLGDTIQLTTEEHGAYLLLLFTAWNSGGYLPADDNRLARIARLTPARWLKMRHVILGYFREADGFLVSPRLLKELQKTEEISTRNSAAGKLGATVKALKNNKPPQANASENDKRKSSKPESIAIREDSVGKPTAHEEGKRLLEEFDPAGFEDAGLAWKMALAVFELRGGIPEKAARAAIGKFAKELKPRPIDVARAAVATWKNGTGAVAPYFRSVLAGNVEDRPRREERPTFHPKGDPDTPLADQEKWIIRYKNDPNKEWFPRHHNQFDEPGSHLCLLDPGLLEKHGFTVSDAARKIHAGRKAARGGA